LTAEANGIVERFHRTALNKFYRVAFRRKIYASIEQLQGDLDLWLKEYNEARAPGALVLRQNPAANVHRQRAAGS
jgi:hypothetical protein